MQGSFESKTVYYRDIIEQQIVYKIPNYQRDYSWNNENWEDLWDGVKEVYECSTGAKKEEKLLFKKTHYMGSIVLQIFNSIEDSDTEYKKFLVVDGQQRLVTLSIITIVSVRLIEEMLDFINKDDRENIEVGLSNLKRLVFVYDSYDRSRDRIKPRLRLNYANASFYENNIVNKDVDSKKLEKTNILLMGCYKSFYNWIKDYFFNKGDYKTIAEKLIRFVNTLKDGIQFITIIVKDEDQAFSIFETINATGSQLSVTDLLKNYFFHNLHSSTKRNIENQWNNVIDNVRYEEFPKFLRFFLLCRFKDVRKDRLFRVVKENFSKEKEIQKLIADLVSCSMFYNGLKRKESDFINENYSFKVKEVLDEIRLLNVTQCSSVFLAMYIRKFKSNDFCKIAQMLLGCVFRHNVCEKSPSRLEPVFNELSINIYNGEVDAPHMVKKILSDSVYISDNEFREGFLRFCVRDAKKTKYILTKIECWATGGSSLLNYTNQKITIEHVLPKSKKGFDFVHMLGNLAIVTKDENKKAGDKYFESKKQIFSKSNFKTTNMISEYQKWDHETVINRQLYLFNIAKGIWKI